MHNPISTTWKILRQTESFQTPQGLASGQLWMHGPTEDLLCRGVLIFFLTQGHSLSCQAAKVRIYPGSWLHHKGWKTHCSNLGATYT